MNFESLISLKNKKHSCTFLRCHLSFCQFLTWCRDFCITFSLHSLYNWNAVKLLLFYLIKSDLFFEHSTISKSLQEFYIFLPFPVDERYPMGWGNCLLSSQQTSEGVLLFVRCCCEARYCFIHSSHRPGGNNWLKRRRRTRLWAVLPAPKAGNMLMVEL